MVVTHFHVYPRKRGNSTTYYYKLRLQDKTWTHGKSTGKKTEAEALQWIEENLSFREQQKPGDDRILFGDYARDFWSPESFYVVSRREFGHRLTETHRHNRENVTKKHLLPAWKNYLLSEMDTVSIKKWLVAYKREGYVQRNKDGSTKQILLSPATMNHIRNTLSQMMDHAVAEGLIKQNPVKPIPRFHGRPKERGILTLDEMRTILNPASISRLWDHEKYYLATFTAAGCGLRLGEVRALRVYCVGNGYIHVAAGWDERAREAKLPKWDRTRTTPAPSKVTGALLDWIEKNDIPPEGWYFRGGR